MSEELKKIATDLYYNKQFDEAILKYEEAFQLDNTNMVYYSNIGACYFEMKNFEKSIEFCEKSLEIGEANHAEFKLRAKALVRMGNCYKQLLDFEKAIFYYNKALIEDNNKATYELLRTVERELEEKKIHDYINPELSDRARMEGNDHFKAGRFPEAIKSYTEAIKRLPDDKVAYTNRATAYIKLLEIPHAIKDCEKALELDDKYVKAYIKKAHAYTLMKDYYKALETYQRALDIEPNNRECEQGVQSTMAKMNEGQDEETVKKNVQNNPELIRILQDPMMQSVLKDLQENNKEALMQHLSNPDIRTKIEKLIQAGVIKTQ